MHSKFPRIVKAILLTVCLAFMMACGLADALTDRAKPTQIASATKEAAQAIPTEEPAEDVIPIATQAPATDLPQETEAPQATTPPQATEEPVAQLSAEEEMYTITSIGAASNGASKPTVFTIMESWLVTEIKTYHWNNGKGVNPGTISLRSDDGTTYGPWQATGLPGQGGVANAYWVVNPQVTIPAGTYTVVDSDPATWAKNDADTGGMGMSWGRGVRMGNP